MKSTRRPSAPKLPKPSAGAPTKRRPPASYRAPLAYALLIAALLIVSAVRIRLLHLPLERDEGEYALMAQLIWKGIPPYELAYNMKLPGTYYAYALLMGLFGQTIEGIRIGLLAVHLISMGLLFVIGRKISGDLSGAVAASAYSLLCLVPNTLGLMAHATHFNVLFMLLGWWLLLRYKEQGRWVLLVNSGLCFGLAFLAKQQAVFFPLFGALWLAWSAWKQAPPVSIQTRLQQLAVFSIAVLLPYGLVLLSTQYHGTFDRFWHWTVDYARQYASVKTFYRAWSNLTINLTNITKGVVWGCGYWACSAG